MKKGILAVLSILIAVSIYAQGQKFSGVVEKVSGQDILVQYENINNPLIIGEKLSLIIENKSIILEVIFPMQTFAKCRLLSSDEKILSKIKKGMIIYGNNVQVRLYKNIKERFAINGDGTITDTQSGLMWIQNANIAEKKMPWSESINYCIRLDANGYSDWRLPTKDEIDTLIKDLPANKDWRTPLAGLGFRNIQYYYWTSTEYSTEKTMAWFVNVVLGSMTFNGYKTTLCYVLPVRRMIKADIK